MKNKLKKICNSSFEELKKNDLSVKSNSMTQVNFNED